MKNLAHQSMSGMGEKSLEKASIALPNSLFVVSVREDNRLIGLGRVVGDGGISYVVTDIMVHKQYQRSGIQTKIMESIDNFLEKNTDENAYIILLANKPSDKF